MHAHIHSKFKYGIIDISPSPMLAFSIFFQYKTYRNFSLKKYILFLTPTCFFFLKCLSLDSLPVEDSTGSFIVRQKQRSCLFLPHPKLIKGGGILHQTPRSPGFLHRFLFGSLTLPSPDQGHWGVHPISNQGVRDARPFPFLFLPVGDSP